MFKSSIDNCAGQVDDARQPTGLIQIVIANLLKIAVTNHLVKMERYVKKVAAVKVFMHN